MSFNANDQESASKFPALPALEAGTYPARLVQLVTMGLQPSRPFQGNEKPPKKRIYTAYELSHEFMPDENGNPDPTKPRWFGEDFPFYNLESDKAKSTLRYNALDPQNTANGDWSKLVGTPCQITLSKEPRKVKGKVVEGQFTNYITHVSGAMNVPGYTQPELVNEPRLFNIDEPDMEVFKALPEWLRKKLTTNLEYAGSALEAAVQATEGAQPQAATPAPTPAPATPPTPPAPPAPPETPVPPIPAAPVDPVAS